jgi:hypothetical protein
MHAPLSPPSSVHYTDATLSVSIECIDKEDLLMRGTPASKGYWSDRRELRRLAYEGD